jgi:hypothetical protein
MYCTERTSGAGTIALLAALQRDALLFYLKNLKIKSG